MKTTDELRPACEGQVDIHDSPMLADGKVSRKGRRFWMANGMKRATA